MTLSGAALFLRLQGGGQLIAVDGDGDWLKGMVGAAGGTIAVPTMGFDLLEHLTGDADSFSGIVSRVAERGTGSDAIDPVGLLVQNRIRFFWNRFFHRKNIGEQPVLDELTLLFIGIAEIEAAVFQPFAARRNNRNLLS